MKASYMIAVLCALGLASCDERESAAPPAGTPRAEAPDNTGVNTRDRQEGAVTAGAAGQSKAEVDMAAEIRKRVTDTKMSVDAQNVKVVVQGNKVTLRGPVASQEEKDAVGKIAMDVAGAGNVDNQLEITGEAVPAAARP